MNKKYIVVILIVAALLVGSIYAVMVEQRFYNERHWDAVIETKVDTVLNVYDYVLRGRYTGESCVEMLQILVDVESRTPGFKLAVLGEDEEFAIVPRYDNNDLLLGFFTRGGGYGCSCIRGFMARYPEGGRRVLCDFDGESYIVWRPMQGCDFSFIVGFVNRGTVEYPPSLMLVRVMLTIVSIALIIALFTILGFLANRRERESNERD